MIRCLLIDDQPLIRSGLAMLINSQADLEVVAEGSDGDEAASLALAHRPDVILMDVRMKRVNGIAATEQIMAAFAADAAPKVLILTTFDLDEYALDAVRAGASGFLLKDVPPEDLLAGIRTVFEGNAVISPTTTKRLLSHMAAELRASENRAADDRALAAQAHTAWITASEVLERLSPREREVFLLVAEGLTNREIMDRLYVTEATVKTHISRILSKLDARDRVHLVVLAYQSGVVSAAPSD